MIHVTITGIDDGVHFDDLNSTARGYPETEWAVLLSAKRMGTPRYPSASWLRELQDYRTHHLCRFDNLAAHLCGALAREPTHAAAAIALGPFRRVQVNGHIVGTAGDWSNALKHVRCRIILQAQGEENLQTVATEARQIGADVLFDPSGGRGVEPFRWPAAPPEVRVGFAGGIKPENVEDVLAAILAGGTRASDDFWIDMESGVRNDDDRFDWNRVVRVLDTVRAVNNRILRAQDGVRVDP